MSSKDGIVRAKRKSQNTFSANFSSIMYVRSSAPKMQSPRNETAKKVNI